MPITGFLTTLPSDVLLLPGQLRAGSTVIGVTRGGGNFDPAFEYENLDWDGKQAPLKGHDRKYHGPARITATLIEFGDSTTGNQIPKLEPGSVNASAGSPNVTTITPSAGGSFLASGDYITDLRWIFDRGVGAGTERYCVVYFSCALVTKYGIGAEGGSRKEAGIPIEIEARKDPASGSVADAPYKIELREALP